MNSLEWFMKCLGSEFLVAVPSLLLGAFWKPAGVLLALLITAVGIYLTLRNNSDSADQFAMICVPSILATISVSLIFAGLDANPIIFVSVVYCCFFVIADAFKQALSPIFR